MNTLQEFHQREVEIDPRISSTLKELGAEALERYAAIELRHKTLSRFVPTIMQSGLAGKNHEAVPDPKDVDFASELFEAKGFYHPDTARQFNRYIKGTVHDRPPGTYFYAHHEHSNPNNYGIPERMHTLAVEMGYVAVHTDPRFTDTEKKEARKIFQKYRQKLFGEDAHIAVLRANPFSAPIINQRLAPLASGAWSHLDIEYVGENLGQLEDINAFEGIYVPGVIPPQDLEILELKENIAVTNLAELPADPFKSRFFYTPPHYLHV